ncbi:Hexokinase [Neofusicoccum parvum]|nr:Hexokinase [Neofusicoccum parvum]
MAHDYAAVLQPLTRHINDRDLLALARGFAATYDHLARHSKQHFLATPVTALPTGRETGIFLAIDVGGTNLRVAFVELLGEAADHDDSAAAQSRGEARKPPKIRRSHERAWPIEEHLKMDQADELFAWIGDCIAGVVADALNDASLRVRDLDEIPMGITFSFPMKYVFLILPDSPSACGSLCLVLCPSRSWPCLVPPRSPGRLRVVWNS